MNILHIVLTPRYSGAEMLVVNLLQEQLRNGHQTAVVAFNPSEESFKPEVTRTSELGGRWYIPATILKGLDRVGFVWSAIRDFRPDVVIAHSVIPSAYARLAVLMRPAVPVISVLHDASNNDYQARNLKWSEKMLTHRANAVVTVSQEAAENYRRLFRHGNVRVIPNGIHLTEYRTGEVKGSEVLEQISLNSEHKYIVQIGRINPMKQQDKTVEAFSRYIIYTGDQSSTVLLIGIIEDQDYHDRLRNRIANLQLEKRILFLGARKDVPDLLRAASLFVMPSAREAHSVALIEALASGIAIIASQIEPFNYAGRMDGVTLIDPSDLDQYSSAIADGLSVTRVHARDLGDFTIQKTARAYESLAESLLMKNKS